MSRPKNRKRIALETIEIYAAIAHRLGMGLVRRELEDIAFQYAYPEDYIEAKKLVDRACKRNVRSGLKKCPARLKKNWHKMGFGNSTLNNESKASGVCGKN